MRLTVGERAFYDANGYVLKKGLLSHYWIVEVKREIEGLHERMAEETPEGVGISWENISLFHSKLLMKAAKDGPAIPKSL